MPKFPRGLFPTGKPVKNFESLPTFSTSEKTYYRNDPVMDDSILTTCSAYLNLPDLITLSIFG